MNQRLVIVGGGPVGLAFALAASRLANVDVTVVERSLDLAVAPSPLAPFDHRAFDHRVCDHRAFDHRVYALSPASLAFLADLAVVPPPSRVAHIRAMQVWGDASAGDGHLDLARGSHLASVVEHSALMFALEAAVVRGDRIQMLRGAIATAMRVDGNRHALDLASGATLQADLLIGADGSRSQIRAFAGIQAATKDYVSEGIVANFATTGSHGDVARQWFTKDTVLAYLPLPRQQMSMVWSVPKALSESLKTLDDDGLAAAVAAAGQHALGKLKLISPVARFPLAQVMASTWWQPGLALIGDAAHAIHPLAGQGVNLGFADARTLAEVLRTRSKFSAIGDALLLRRYARQRHEATLALSQLTDQLRALYARESRPARWIRNDGLGLLNRVPTLKAALIDYAIH